MRKKLKIFVIIVNALFITLIATACGENSEAAGDDSETEVLRVAFNQNENHPQYKALESFGEKFNELTDGQYELEVSPNELLGGQRETVELVQSGTIDMAVVGGSLMENFNQDFVVFNLPYVFDSIEHQMQVINDQEIVSGLYRSVEDEGMIIAGGFHGGVRNVYNNQQPVYTPGDMNSLKIRVMESDTNVQMMELMGGIGTPMGQGEVYTAIQSGVLEGGENNELIYNELAHFEVAPYYSLTQHLMVPDYLIINSDRFNGMSDEYQEIFMEELSAAIDLEVELFDTEVQEAMEAAENAGAEFNEVDISVFQDEAEPLIQEKLTSETSKELYEKIREAAE
ncbi:TRAP transporter substrate-binding protein [Oceanobacillus jeddahense]|uniref:TRAP transporter substrate-binding protein n=1 Tax=Oceanobacillus jeddahense TaxID=1462527 RepID=UPI0036318C1F